MRVDIKERIDKINRGEVPEGYKKTKFGITPRDWETIQLSQEVEKFIVPMRDKPKIFNGTIPWCRIEDIEGKYLSKSLSNQNVSEEVIKDMNLKIHPKGTVICSCSARLGVSAITTRDIITNQTFIGLVPSKGLDKEFLFYTMGFNEQRLQNLSSGTTIAYLSREEFEKFKIIIPNIFQQQKIASILSTWDKAIELKENLIQQKKEQKKGLMQNLLTGKVRLDGFDGEWEEIRLGNVFERITRKNTNGNNNVLTISAQNGLIRQTDFFNKTVASSILDNYYLLRKGEFAYNKSYSKGYPMGAIKRLNLYESGVVTTLYICFEIKDTNKADADFFEQYFESGLLNKPLTQIAQEGGRDHGLLNVSTSDFFNLKMVIPTKEEQTGIAEILCASDKEIELHQKELENLKHQKKGLMDILLTGKVRVEC